MSNKDRRSKPVVGLDDLEHLLDELKAAVDQRRGHKSLGLAKLLRRIRHSRSCSSRLSTEPS